MDLHVPMTQTSPATPIPATGPRWWLRLARGLVWTLVWSGVALLLVWGCIHAVIVPRIGDFRPWIERQVVQKNGRQPAHGRAQRPLRGVDTDF